MSNWQPLLHPRPETQIIIELLKMPLLQDAGIGARTGSLQTPNPKPLNPKP